MYRWVEHTAELELEIDAATEAEVFAEALAAFGELVGQEPGGEPARHEVEASGSDRGALLAAWLEELEFLAETEDFVPERLEELELAEGRLRAAVAGRRDRPPHLVKAVTYHGLALEPAGKGWRARMVLDV